MQAAPPPPSHEKAPPPPLPPHAVEQDYQDALGNILFFRQEYQANAARMAEYIRLQRLREWETWARDNTALAAQITRNAPTIQPPQYHRQPSLVPPHSYPALALGLLTPLPKLPPPLPTPLGKPKGVPSFEATPPPSLSKLPPSNLHALGRVTGGRVIRI